MEPNHLGRSVLHFGLSGTSVRHDSDNGARSDGRARGMNDETVERIGRNEALFRFANEERDRLVDEAGVEGRLFVCGGGYPWCHEMICVTPDDYQRVRSRPDQFFVIPGHEIPNVEFVE